MTTLDKILKKRAPSGDLGVEVEVEWQANTGCAPSTAQNIPHWIMKSDGSLRCGHEFVTRQPAKMCPELKTKKLDPLFAVIGPHIQKGAFRASTHVHVNALRLTPLELMNTATLWWLVEDLMMEYCGDERKTNRYCAPINTSSGNFDRLLELFSTGDALCDGPNHTYAELGERYMALNLSSLLKFGSLEYRGMRASHESESVYNWMRTLHRLQLDLSRQFKHPLSITDKFLAAKDKKAFIKNIIGPYINIEVGDEQVDMVEEQLLFIYPWAVMTDNWQEWEKDIIKRSSEKKEEPANPTTTNARYPDQLLSTFRTTRTYPPLEGPDY